MIAETFSKELNKLKWFSHRPPTVVGVNIPDFFVEVINEWR